MNQSKAKAISQPRFLIRHLGNMGDMVFFIPPILETLKKKYPNCHITFVTTWGFKEKTYSLFPYPRVTEKWGNRNQSGFCIALMRENKNVDSLIHWHDTALSLDGSICQENGRRIPTWNKSYYEKQKKEGGYTNVFELDFGIGWEENPMQALYAYMGMPEEDYSNYTLDISEEDKEIAKALTDKWESPRIMLLEGLEGKTTRGWDPGKIKELENAIEKKYGVRPRWFGGRHAPYYKGKQLSITQNIATLAFCDVGIGVLSGPIHFAGAMRLPTITLYGDQPLHRAAPAYFLNPYIKNPKKLHRTILGASPSTISFLKHDKPSANLTPKEKKTQGNTSWQNPGRQSTKSALSVITTEEIMRVMEDIL